LMLNADSEGGTKEWCTRRHRREEKCMASNRRKTDLSSDKVSVQVAMPREQGNRGKKLEMHGGCLSLTDSGLPASWQEN
jgi:hypothetical protein